MPVECGSGHWTLLEVLQALKRIQPNFHRTPGVKCTNHKMQKDIDVKRSCGCCCGRCHVVFAIVFDTELD